MKTAANSALAERYERDGFLLIPELFSAGECDRLKTEARRVLARHAKPGASVYVHCAVVSPEFARLAADARLVDVLRQIMPDGVMFLSDKLVFKSADKVFPTPWHIDSFYWRHTRPKLSVWIPLDDATAENGTLTVVPGSHKKDWQMVKKGLPNGEFTDEIRDPAWRAEEVAVCALRRGGAIIFSDRLVHGSTRNTAGQDRFAIIGTYHAPAADEPFDRDFPARKVLAAADK